MSAINKCNSPNLVSRLRHIGLLCQEGLFYMSYFAG